MEKVLSEIGSKLHSKGVEDFFLTGVTDKGVNFFVSKGDIGVLISGAIERMFITDPQKAMGLISELLRSIADWYELDSKRKTVH